jgi:hypothetical protein
MRPVVAIAVFIASFCTTLRAQDRSSVSQPFGAGFAVPTAYVESPRAAHANSSTLRVEMEASRAQSTAGEGIGVTSEVVNDSGKPITIRESSFTLTVPPEMTGAFNDTRTWYAYFPTEHKPDDPRSGYAELTLQPKSSYQVFWTPSDLGRRRDGNATAPGETFRGVADQFANSLSYLFFAPGDYKITAQVKYWDGPSDPAVTYRTAQKSTTIHLAAPQSVIMLGAIIGGLIAYTILPQ